MLLKPQMLWYSVEAYGFFRECELPSDEAWMTRLQKIEYAELCVAAERFDTVVKCHHAKRGQ